VHLSADRASRIAASLDDSALTHFDPRCQLSCAMLNGSIAHAIHAFPPATPSDLVAAALEELTFAAAELGRRGAEAIPEVSAAASALREDLRLAAADDPALFGPELYLHAMPSSVRVTLRLAYWELLHAPSFEAGVLDAVGRGGDTSANASATGALLGALHGEDALPGDWKLRVLGALPAEPGPLRDRYHPRALLTLVL
jgi:ADP-ribosylglycohydrolase